MEFEPALSDRSQWSIGDGCSMTRVLNVLSTKTAFQVLRELFFGTVRFDDFVDRIGSSAPAVSRALKQLETAGIVARETYQEPGQRARDQYRLTDAGEDLLPVFLSLVQWGDKHLRDGQPGLVFEDDSGEAVCVTAFPAHSSDIRVRRPRR
jgi:DNA-binding HxlR family transcriptional regulator